jgi:hypothetical protein
MSSTGNQIMRLITAVTALLLLTTPAFAHEPRKGPNGGDLVDAGAYHIEVSAKGTMVDVFVSDTTDRPVSAAGFKALAIIVIDGKPQRVALEPTGDNKKLSGTAPAPVATMKGAIQLTDKDGNSATGRVN